LLNLCTITKPKPGITGIDLGTPLGLGLVLALGLVISWNILKEDEKDKIINIEFAQDKYIAPWMANEECFIIHIFDLNKKKNITLQRAYGQVSVTNFTVVDRVVKLVFPTIGEEIEFTVLNSCHYNGKNIKQAIGFTDSCRLFRELGPISNIPEETGTYIPASSKIKTASYPYSLLDIRSYK
jgi:hypothetical protein